MKKSIELELEEYKWYLSSFFPYCSLSKESDTEIFSDFFDKVLTLSKICQCLSDNENLKDYSRLIEYNLNNLLYFLPLNESVSINMSIRNATEYLIKLIFSLQYPEESFLESGYRTLKDSRANLSFYSSNKSSVDTLFQIYGSRSNIVHLKKSHQKKVLTSVLEEKLTSQFDDKELKAMTIDIKNCMLSLLESIYFYEIGLSTQQKIVLAKIVTKKWKERLNSIM